MLAWHFLKSDRKLAYSPHTPVLTGQLLTVDPGRLDLCTYGLHASERALDALKYAPGPIVCRVRLGGRILTGGGKACASERTVIAMADATETLRAFARACALDVIDKWDAPAVVREYLETGNEDLRKAAEIAAWSARSAAYSAESADSAESAARSAWSAESAAEIAAWSAARSAWSAADSAARSARSAESAESAAWSKQNTRLEAMLFDLLQIQEQPMMFYALLTEAEVGLLRALVGDYPRRLILDMRETGLTDEGKARYRGDIDEAGRVAASLADYRQDIRPDVSVLIQATERIAELLQNDLAPISKDRIHAARSAIRALRDRGIA